MTAAGNPGCDRDVAAAHPVARAKDTVIIGHEHELR